MPDRLAISLEAPTQVYVPHHLARDSAARDAYGLRRLTGLRRCSLRRVARAIAASACSRRCAVLAAPALRAAPRRGMLGALALWLVPLDQSGF